MTSQNGLLIPRAGTHIVHEIEIKRSRFIATIARTDTSAEARALIDLVKSEHPQARHNCSAYLIHEDGQSPIQHSSDDGEPAGTAGTPMLEAIRATNTWNVTAVVTRYFGGVLLGAGGLIRAYSSAVSQALALVPRSHQVHLDVLETSVPVTDAGRIESELRHAGGHILDVTWGTDVCLKIGVEKGLDSRLSETLARLTGGQSVFHNAGTYLLEVDASPTQS